MRNIKIIVQIDRLNLFSDIWMKYYIKFFESKCFYFIFEKKFIDEQIFKEYLEKFGFNLSEINLLPVDDIPSDTVERMGHMNNFVNNLVLGFLDGNTVVIYLDIDELIYHSNLLELLQTFDSDFLITTPIDILQNLEFEQTYDKNLNLFEQRKYCLSEKNPIFSWYKKNNIIKSNLNWKEGRHFYGSESTPGLFLIHLGKFDYEFLEKLNTENLKMYERQNINQNGLTGNELKEWYLSQLNDLNVIDENLLNIFKNFNL